MIGGEHVTAEDIVAFCRNNQNGIDFAVPQPWLDKVRELGIKEMFVYSYQEQDGSPTWGQPVGLGEMLLKEVAEGRAIVLTTDEYAKLVGE